MRPERQAAPAVRNLHLTAELTARLETIRRQATELAASRARVASAQDAERRRIQRDLHDGVQQDVVVLTAPGPIKVVAIVSTLSDTP